MILPGDVQSKDKENNYHNDAKKRHLKLEILFRFFLVTLLY